MMITMMMMMMMMVMMMACRHFPTDPDIHLTESHHGDDDGDDDDDGDEDNDGDDDNDGAAAAFRKLTKNDASDFSLPFLQSISKMKESSYGNFLPSLNENYASNFVFVQQLKGKTAPMPALG